MKKILLMAAIAAAVMAACTDEEESTRPCHMSPPYMDISILDKDSCDLLNPSNENGYKESEIGFFGDSALTINYIASYEGHVLCTDENATCYSIVLPVIYNYHEEKNGETIYCSKSYLKLNSVTIDTIYTECLKTKCGMNLAKVVYNGEDITETRIVVRH